ncbi:phosphatase PAP2 family protein [Oceanirhabdus sp. W0125-5]|uniref:phosphatase PAP2 family protein n=1 Tax=Oceanirhabdus sp. W0125-5 TaxID=2999116 RepID=UPI0022F2E1BD|nr:phosphatase PAP2 family protein [Oceanirhabdus sp. W0125-5]WBW97463.1 phosphatase PAP2 family protein [Oceanirhabdus sp. W0125-5]
MNIQKLFDKYNHFLYLLLFIPTLIIFTLLQAYIDPQYIMHSQIDDHIPFISGFIVFYVIWYAYIGWCFIYMGIRSKDEFMRFFKFIFWGTLISYLIYILFPNGQNLRNPLATTDAFSYTINLIRSVDPPTNVFPSLHVYNSLGVFFAVSSYFRNDKKYFSISVHLILSLLICASTVFIKQHSILDVIASTILAFLLYFIIYLIPRLQSKSEVSEIK